MICFHKFSRLNYAQVAWMGVQKGKSPWSGLVLSPYGGFVVLCWRLYSPYPSESSEHAKAP